MDHIAAEQRKHKDISHMMDWLQGEEPDEGIPALASPPSKHMWLNRQLFSIIEITLYRADPEDRGSTFGGTPTPSKGSPKVRARCTNGGTSGG
ncbi:hypothetical protein PoB_006260300 [Plakobranchus ocellatus]|uniref:Uncharacterized protein n=1 Tax=Plakobranchus ocellatus TaxID=259542 RepID=A0AAV4CW60_9GAST|nr:hypothetical protein PoB_006260300 [Plakobranchus ocellatus]